MWEKVKDNWEIITAVFSVIFGGLVWLKKQPRETAEAIKAKAEARRINREIDAFENKEIDEMRDRLYELTVKLNKMSEELRKAYSTIDQLTRDLTVYRTFKSVFNKNK